MSMSDTLGDMLTRIRNGQMASKKAVNCPWSKLHESVSKVLQEEGFIRSYKVEDLDKAGNKKQLRIELKYDEGEGAIRKIDRVSRPGRRVYTKVDDMQPYYNGLGVKIMSTPKGVMTDHRAREENVGGEVLCQLF